MDRNSQRTRITSYHHCLLVFNVDFALESKPVTLTKTIERL